MRTISKQRLLRCGLVTVFLLGCAGRSQPAEWDGLVQQQNTRLHALFVKPDAEIAGYRSVLLDPIQVRFARNGIPDRAGRNSGRRLDAADATAIQTGLAEMFREIFDAELRGAGYQIVEQAGPDTLRVTSAIVDLYVVASDMIAGRDRTYTADASRMTLVLEVRDSVTGEILARAVDTRRGRAAGVWTITNRRTNTADARRAIGVWATGLRQALAEMYTPTS